MRRFFLIPLLAFGTIAGFASGFHSLHAHHCGWHDDWRQGAYEDRFAPPPVAPVTVQQQAPAPAPAPAQTLVIPIIVGVPQGTAAAPTTYVVPVPTTVQQPAAVVQQPAPAK